MAGTRFGNSQQSGRAGVCVVAGVSTFVAGVFSVVAGRLAVVAGVSTVVTRQVQTFVSCQCNNIPFDGICLLELAKTAFWLLWPLVTPW